MNYPTRPQRAAAVLEKRLKRFDELNYEFSSIVDKDGNPYALSVVRKYIENSNLFSEMWRAAVAKIQQKVNSGEYTHLNTPKMLMWYLENHGEIPLIFSGNTRVCIDKIEWFHTGSMFTINNGRADTFDNRNELISFVLGHYSAISATYKRDSKTAKNIITITNNVADSDSIDFLISQKVIKKRKFLEAERKEILAKIEELNECVKVIDTKIDTAEHDVYMEIRKFLMQ